MARGRLVTIGRSLAVNFLVSWLVLPFALPPFEGYSAADLLEVLLWQVFGFIGWPIAVLGGLFSLVFAQARANPGSLLLTLIYPILLLLFARAVFSKCPRRWELYLLHLLLAFSFAAVWYNVLNGYDFMVG